MTELIPIFIGYDQRERAATNVLIDSLLEHSSIPLAITPLRTPQLVNMGLYWRQRDPLQSTDFSFSRFLVPKLMSFQGWAIFMDCDMLCRGDIASLWRLRDPEYAVQCVQHVHIPSQDRKFLDEPQSNYPKKNWSSLMLFNCRLCTALSVNYVNSASGLDLHRFHWLEDEQLIGPLPMDWNHLVAGQNCSESKHAALLHWTMGGPWFQEQRTMGGELAAEWFSARDQAMRLWN